MYDSEKAVEASDPDFDQHLVFSIAGGDDVAGIFVVDQCTFLFVSRDKCLAAAPHI